MFCSKKREVVPDLAPMLWHSFGTVAALLQEIVNVYPAINPPHLTVSGFLKLRPSQWFGEHGNKGIYFRGTMEQRSKNVGNKDSFGEQGTYMEEIKI